MEDNLKKEAAIAKFYAQAQIQVTSQMLDKPDTPAVK